MDERVDLEPVEGPEHEVAIEMNSLYNHNTSSSDQGQEREGAAFDFPVDRSQRARSREDEEMFEDNSDIFDVTFEELKDEALSPGSKSSVVLNGRRQRIASANLEVIDDKYLQYRRHSAVSVARPQKPDGSVTIASAFLEEEAFSTIIFLNPLVPERNFFEVEITTEGSNCVFAVGVGPRKYPLTVMPGWLEGSFGYHANGKLFIEQGDTPIKGPRCRKGHRMGCGIDFSCIDEGYIKVWFTKDGRLACRPEKIAICQKQALYPLISVGSSGEVVHYCSHEQKITPDISTIYPWYVVEGFSDTNEVPFYSREQSVLSCGMWPGSETGDAKSDPKMSWAELREGLWDGFPEYLRTLGSLSPLSYAEWLDMAENALRGSEKYAKLGKAPNGEQFKRVEQMAVFMAQEVLSALEGLKSGLDIPTIGILSYLSLGIDSQYLNITVVAGLLYLGCSANSSTKTRHVFHNPDISVSLVNLLLNWGGNPNVPDAIGRTPLHIHQTNRGLMRTFLDHNADVNALDDERNSPLHYAGVWGRSGVADLLIEHGAVANVSFGGRPTSLDVTASAGHFSCFKSMLKVSIKNMTNKKVQQQMVEDKWKDAVSDLPKWKKVKLKEIEEMTNEEFYYVTVKQNEGDEDRYSLKRLVTVAHENKIALKHDVLNTIFDRCVYGQHAVIADILDADVNGNVDPASMDQDEGTSLFTYLSSRPKLLLSLVSHETLKAYISDQWQKHALLIFWFRTLFFYFQLILLTLGLAIAARPGITDQELQDYSEPIDIARAVCELSIILLMIIKMFDELFELILGGMMEYVMDVTNYIQWLGIILILLIIPLRVIDHPGQWIVASLAYMAFGLRALYFASLFDSTGAYVQALGIIISRDVVKFLAMFFIVMIIFGGAFYFSLRYDESQHILSNGTFESSFHPGETSYLHEIYLSGLRTMIESGPTIDYYEESSSFGFLAVMWYLLFLFIVVIVLLNVLIAQVSDTYAKVLEKAEGFKLFNQCMYIAKVQEQKNKLCMTHGLYMFMHKSTCGARLYKVLCSCSCFEDCLRTIRSKISVTEERPRIITSSGTHENSTSQFAKAKKKIGQVVAHYFPDTLQIQDSNEGTGEEDLELKVDATNQNLKELGQDLHSLLARQHEQFSNLMSSTTTLLLNELAFQKNKIQADINISEEQEGLMVHFLTQLKDLRSTVVAEMDDIKAQNESDQLRLQEKLADIMQKQETSQAELTSKQVELQEEVTRQQMEVKSQLAQQDQDLHRDIDEHQLTLQAQLHTQQTDLKSLSKQQEESREYFSTRQSELDVKITLQQNEVKSQLTQQDSALKKDMSGHQDSLEQVMVRQQEELKLLSEQQEKSRAFLLSQQNELEQRLTGQQKALHESVVKQQEQLMAEFPRQKEELSRIITSEMVAINRDFLFLYESAMSKTSPPPE